MTENNSLNEWSDGEDDWILGINENNAVCEGDSDLWEWSDPETADIIRNMIVDDSEWSNDEPDDMFVHDSERGDPETDGMNVDDSEWSDSEADDMIRNMIVDDSEWSNDELDDMFVHDSERGDPETDGMNVDDSEWSDSEADDMIRNMIVDDSEWSNDELDDMFVHDSERGDPETDGMNVDDSEWSDSEADDMIRNMIVDDSEWSDPQSDTMDVHELTNPGTDDVIRDIQTGRGKKRKSDEPLLLEKDFYEIESVKKHHSKKFGMTATDHIIRFNTVLSELDLIESYERTQAIFQHILNDVTRDMNEKDQVRFVLRSEQLDLPISIPFIPLAQLTTERVFSQIERVIQSNQDFRLNDTVTVDIIRVEEPQGGTSNGKSKRTTLNIREYLKKKRSIITINNNDDLCLGRALAVAVARIENDPKYHQIRKSDREIQLQRALQLHRAANVPLGLCGLDEVKLFQKYFTDYEITVVSGDHDDSIIYPPEPGDKQPIYLYFQNKHFDVITKMPGFLSVCYFCHKCRKTYSNATDHMCPAMCKSCRSFDCVFEEWVDCDQCKRKFKSRACYDHHKEPVGAARSVCQTMRKCEKCGKVTDVRKMKSGHICGRKCKTCGIILKEEDGEHKCYIQKLELPEEEQYNHLLFFDFEATQEHSIHEPNLCVVHDEKGEAGLFKGKDTVKQFCEWLLTKEHKDCIVIAHNFQGYDAYFIIKYLIQNAIKYEFILRGAKVLSMTIPMFNIKFIDSLNFIPMSLAKFPKTFGQDEMCKGYFPHLFNKEENWNYVGPIPCQNDYNVNFMEPEERKAFIAWHKEQVESNYLFDFQKEIVKYCRSDVDIMRKCCLLFREMLRDETGIDPFGKSLTIASYCHEVYRTKFLKENTIAVFTHDRQLKTKQSNMAVKWLTYVAEKEGIHIQHVRNGGGEKCQWKVFAGWLLSGGPHGI